MMSQPLPQEFSDLLDWRSLCSARTELLSEHFQKAVNLSKSIHLPSQRWEVYLCTLAVLGFEQWLKERAPDLRCQTNSATIWQPAYANLMAAACSIQVGDFKICLITSSNLTNQHSISFAALDIPDFVAHFYVLIQVEEEQQQIAVSGFLNYEQYHRHQQATQLQVDTDWTYSLPSTWFNPDADALLLNLRCLPADAIQLPIITPPQKNNTVLQQKLKTLTSQLKTRHPWQLLTVKEGTTLLSNPNLIELAYKIINPSPIEPLINVGLWLSDRIDGLAQELGWMLMPSPVLSSMRSLREQLDNIRAALEQQGAYIPLTAGGAYRDLGSEQSSLRMYVITWVLSEIAEKPEWMLLVVLGPQPQAKMPESLRLEVRDKIQILFGESLGDTSQGILYAQVIGDWKERFWVTVTTDDGVFEIPPFGFELE
jgi:Protein of unknown function (DUF1822)